MRPSRYDPVRAFEPNADGTLPFAGVMPRLAQTPVGVVEHVVAEGDRLDALAHEYYNDSRLWWHILDANPQIECGADVADPDLYASAAAGDASADDADDAADAAEDRTGPPLRPNLVGSTIVIPAPPGSGAP